MIKTNDAWLARETRRWLRPDAHRWVRPDYARFLPPHERKVGFDPEQPRDEWGRWTETGAEEDAEENEEAEGLQLDEFGSASRPRGHHFVAKYAYRDLPLQPETKKVFDQATTGPLQAGPHRYSLDHAAYNDAVKHSLMQFMRDNGIIAETMTPDLAQRFLDSVKRSSDPRIRDFNLKIFRREVNHAIRRLGRRPE